MAEFMMIPEVYINEQLGDKKINVNTSNFCDETSDPLNFLQGPDTSPMKIKTESVEKLIGIEDPLALLDPLFLTSDDNTLQVVEGLSENTVNSEQVTIKKGSDFEEYSNVHDSSHPLEAKIENDIFSDSFSEDASCEEQHELCDPHEKTCLNEIQNNKKPFECPLCHKWFKTSSAMNGHVAKSHKTTLGEKFVCHVCGAPGSSRASLKRHLIRTHKILNIDHPELLTKKCFHCDIGFASHEMKFEHIRSSHVEQLKLYHHCQWCPALMKAKASLIRHVRRAHPGKEHLYSANVPCTVCSLELANIPLLQRHMKKEHPDYIRHKCDSCTASFKFPYMLAKHKILHEDPVKYLESCRKRKYSVICDICSRKFDSKPRLIKHIKNVHSDLTLSQVKAYTCRLCGSAFPTAKQNNRHYRRVHRPGRQKVHCGKCNITFKTPQECDEHRATHPNTCEICQKQFLRRDTLREHLLIHAAPRHNCPHCDKKFTQRSNLKRHIRVHTGEKPFRCSYCSRSFSDKSACNSHTYVHTGYERSVCDICGASFSKKQRLKYHMRLHSGKGLLHCPLCIRSCTTSYALRKHIESHLVPLTKALKSLGFGPLFQSDSSFVQNALQTVTQATLNDSITKFDASDNKEDDLGEFDSVDPISCDESNKLPCEVTLKEEQQDCKLLECSEESEIDNKLDLDNFGSDSSTTTNFNLTKFLKGILEKESLKMRKKKILRKRSDLVNYNELYSPLADEEDYQNVYELDRDEELPETVGDELVKQCLEIVMKDEINWEENKRYGDEYDNSENDTGSDKEYSTDRENFIGSVNVCDNLVTDNSEQIILSPDNIKKENESEHKQFMNFPNSSAFQRIPKLKISRISCKENENLGKRIFIAEVIEND